ncbi:MAG: hypothetical protein OXH77_05945 [Anaerolineaceae bacterium]|nr:hypothetical protein [Anaerolineaceae bacterium]
MKEEEQVPASESDRNPVSDEKSLDTLESKELEQPHELLEKLPPEQREVAMQFMASFSEFHTRVPAINPLINKF